MTSNIKLFKEGRKYQSTLRTDYVQCKVPYTLYCFGNQQITEKQFKKLLVRWKLEHIHYLLKQYMKSVKIAFTNSIYFTQNNSLIRISDHETINKEYDKCILISWITNVDNIVKKLVRV